MSFEDILVILGDFGRYQKYQVLLISLAISASAWYDMGNVFLSGSSDHYCRIHKNQTYRINSPLKNCTIPYKIDKGVIEWSQCVRYNRTVPECHEGGTDVIRCDKGWVYDTRAYERTVVHD
ncbi:solute carrier family 22 member 6-B-like, partial [Saccoglossus kowalevskii]